jgi:hypothetical protein
MTNEGHILSQMTRSVTACFELEAPLPCHFVALIKNLFVIHIKHSGFCLSADAEPIK